MTLFFFSHSLKDYKRHVAEILSILDAAYFKVSPPKCTIAVHQIQFLSHIITKSILRFSQNKTQTILDIPKRIILSVKSTTIESLFQILLASVPQYTRLPTKHLPNDKNSIGMLSSKRRLNILKQF